MALSAGTRLGPYEIVAAIDAGGAPAARARRAVAERARVGVGTPRAQKEAGPRAQPGVRRWR